MELILKITWTWYGEELSLALSRTNVIGVNKRIIRLESYAFLCFNLLSGLQKNSIKWADQPPPNTPNNNYFSPEKEKEKKKKKKICLSKSQESGGCQGFLSEYYPTNGRCGDCDKNPKGLTLKDGKRNGYLCIFIFFLG